MLFVIPFSRSLLHSRQPRAESHTEREGGRERERGREMRATSPSAGSRAKEQKSAKRGKRESREAYYKGERAQRAACLSSCCHQSSIATMRKLCMRAQPSVSPQPWRQMHALSRICGLFAPHACPHFRHQVVPVLPCARQRHAAMSSLVLDSSLVLIFRRARVLLSR